MARTQTYTVTTLSYPAQPRRFTVRADGPATAARRAIPALDSQESVWEIRNARGALVWDRIRLPEAALGAQFRAERAGGKARA